jgi:hypothetical protein
METVIYEKHIPKYTYDTPSTFRERIAERFDTIPGWVYITEPYNETKILVKEIEDGNFNPKLIDRSKFDLDWKEFLLVWLNVKRSKSKLERQFLRPQFEQELKGANVNQRDAAEILEILFDREKNGLFMTSFLKKIAQNKKKVETRDMVFQKITTYAPEYLPPFQKRESLITITIDHMVESIETFFAQLICSLHAPVATCSPIYKQYEYARLPERWKSNDYYVSQPNSVVMMLYSQTTEPSTTIQEDDYIMCIITLSQDKKIQVEYVDTMLPLNAHEIAKRILNCVRINESVNIITKKEEEIKGNYIFPCKSFHTLIMSDMIMNDPTFSSFVTVDESRYASKKKGGLSLRVFIKEEEIKCTLTSSNRHKDTDDYKYVKMIPIYKLPENGNFIRLYVKHASHMEILPTFIDLFSRLLAHYYRNQGAIRSIYESYKCNPLSPIVSPDCSDAEIKIENLEVYTKNYTRQCPKDRIPTIVGVNVDEEVQNTHTMTFPSQDSNLIPQTVPKHTYTCEGNDKNFLHIGLQENTTLDNKETYPYIPCCFNKSQFEKNSQLRNYLDNKHPRDIEKKEQQTTRITQGFIGSKEDDMGFLPENLDRIFLYTEKREHYEYRRQGVFDTVYSFLECVYTAVNDKKPTQEELHTEYIRLCNLTKPEFAIASQEHPGETPGEIHSLFQNTPYVDPRKWCALLEKQYTCKIVTFSRKREQEDATLVFPDHSMAYLQYAHPNPSIQTVVCVYEHYGVDMYRPHPLCELIVFIKGGIKTRHLFGGNTNIVRYQQDSIAQFSFGRTLQPIHAVVIPFTHDMIESQFIDSYGKTRALRINDTVNKFTVLTSPLPPLNKPVIDENELYQNNDLKNIEELITHYSLSPFSYFSGGDDIELTCKDKENEITYTFKLKRTTAILQSLQKAPIQQYPHYPSVKGQLKWVDKNQKIIHYFTERRLALCMTEYFVYFYSFWIHTKQFDLNNINHLREFMNNVVIERDVLYEIPHTPEISVEKLNKYKFVKNMNFIVSNEETRRRLLYVLRNRISSQQETVRLYYLQLEMNHFYEDRYHYASIEQKHTIVTTDLHSIVPLDQQIYDHLLPTSRQFIAQPILGGTCLVKEHETQEQAMRDAQKWNPDANSLYVYNSKTDIQNIQKKGSSNGGVLVYQKDGRHYLSVCVL